MPKDQFGPEREAVASLASNFVDEHPDQFPPQYGFLVGWPTDGKDSQNFANVIRRRETDNMSSVVAEAVEGNEVNRVETYWNKDGTVSRRTKTLYKAPLDAAWKQDSPPNVDRAQRVFTALSQQMQPK